MKKQSAFLVPAISLLALTTSCGGDVVSVNEVSYRGWDRSVMMSDGIATVVLNPEYGGGVTYFGLVDGREAAEVPSESFNVLWNDDMVDGWHLSEYAVTGRSPAAGRFDVGNERKTEHLHDVLWAGEYEVLAGRDGSVTLTSPDCDSLGIRLERRYSLSGGVLTIRHKMTNISDAETEYCFWTRTLLPSGGIFFCTYDSTAVEGPSCSEMAFEPDRLVSTDGCDDRVSFAHGHFTALPGGDAARKFGMANTDGNTFYLRDGILYVKRYPVFPDEEYNCNPGHGKFPMMIYFNEDFIEMEPNSPMFRLAPGDTVTLEEKWELHRLG